MILKRASAKPGAETDAVEPISSDEFSAEKDAAPLFRCSVFFLPHESGGTGRAMTILEQIYFLVGLSLVVASIAWTVTQEEIFREPREYCAEVSSKSENFLVRKFFYVFTCEYCFSHWVTILVLFVTGYRFLYDDYRGYGLAFFVIPWIANQWMSLYRRLRVEIKYENALAENEKNEAKS